jgi:hypothetical protein
MAVRRYVSLGPGGALREASAAARAWGAGRRNGGTSSASVLHAHCFERDHGPPTETFSREGIALSPAIGAPSWYREDRFAAATLPHGITGLARGTAWAVSHPCKVVRHRREGREWTPDGDWQLSAPVGELFELGGALHATTWRGDVVRLVTGAAPRILHGAPHRVFEPARIVGASDTSVTVLAGHALAHVETDDGRSAASDGFPTLQCTSFRVLSGSGVVLATDACGVARVWRLHDGSPLHVILDGRGKLGRIVVSRDERILALGCRGFCTEHNPCPGCEHSAWSLWSLETGEALPVRQDASRGMPGEDELEVLAGFVLGCGARLDVEEERAALAAPDIAAGLEVHGRQLRVGAHVWVGDADITAATWLEERLLLVGDAAGGVYRVRLHSD